MLFHSARPMGRVLLTALALVLGLCVLPALAAPSSMRMSPPPAVDAVDDEYALAADGQIEIGFRHQGLDVLIRRMDILVNRMVIALVAVGGVIGSALIGVFAESGPQIFGLNAVAFVGFGLSGLLGAWLVWGVIRSGRL